jgi:ribonuclease D
VAIDTEFHRENSYYPRLALIQMAIGTTSYLIDPLALDLSVLAELFEAGNVQFIFHAAEQDLEILERAVGSRPVQIFDTQIAAEFLGYARPSLATLTQTLLNVSLTKTARLSDWLSRPLSEVQLDYAVSDVLYLKTLCDRLTKKLTNLGRLEWAIEEMDSLAAKRREETPDEQLWTKIRECRNLDSRGRVAASALAAWRENRARELDVPPRTVLGDMALASIARIRPASPAELFKLRGIERTRLRKELANEIIEVVTNSGNQTLIDIRYEPSDTSVNTNKPVLLTAMALVEAKAAELGIFPGLLTTKDQVNSFIINRSGPLSKGWRYRVVGLALEELLAGKLELSVSGGTKLVAKPAGNGKNQSNLQ